MTKLLTAKSNVFRIIVGHTPQADFAAKTRCGGRIVLADVMMSRWMVAEAVDETSSVGGRPVAIVMSLNAPTHELDAITAHFTELKTGTAKECADLMREPMRTVVEMASPIVAIRIGGIRTGCSKRSFFRTSWPRYTPLIDLLRWCCTQGR